MRKPRDNEYVRCPDATSARRWKPVECWDSEIGRTGKRITYGVLGKHHHRLSSHSGDCSWTGCVVPVETEQI